nr:F0F1 ATP synthase subunit delta [Frigidibacter sp. ROC022]
MRRGVPRHNEGVDVSESVSISSGIASRYATAVFELAREGKALAQLESDVDALDAVITENAEFRGLISSPVVSRGDQRRSIDAITAKMGLSEVMQNTLSLMADKRRLFVLPQLVVVLREMIAADKGEVTAEVTAAKTLTKAQSEKLASTLKNAVGKDVKINLAVDESLIGGLVVKVGSRMIDSSVRSKLANLQNAMKEVR